MNIIISMEAKILDLFKKHLIPILLSLFLAIGFILVFSSSTSPLSYYYNGDSVSPTITISKGWYYGFIPYKDLFGTEGPFLYFLGKVGFTLSHGDKTGICIIQIINMFVFLLSIYLITKLVTHNKFYICFVLVLVCCLLKMNYTDGFYAEEFLLPLYSLSLYCFLTNNKCPLLKSFFLGISLGVVCMCAHQYMIIFIGIVVMYLISLFMNKQWKQFILSILLILFGIVLIIVPFIFYFYKNDCLSEFIYDAFQYKKDIYFTQERSSYIYTKLVSLRYPTLFLFIVSIISLFKKKYYEAISYLFIGCIEIYVFYQMNFENCYSMFIVGNVVLLTNAIYEIIPFHNKQKEMNILSLIFITIPIYFLFTFIYPVQTNRIYSYQNVYHNEGWEGLLDHIDSEDFDSLMFYGSSTMNNAYILSNQMPYYKYFYNQDSICEDDAFIQEDLINTFQNSDVKWIITNHSTDTIQNILDTRYRLIEKDGMYSIYLLIE